LVSKTAIGITAIIVTAGILSSYFTLVYMNVQNEVSNDPIVEVTPINLKMKGEGGRIYLQGEFLFEVFSYEGDRPTPEEAGVFWKHMYFEKKPENQEIYDELEHGNNPQKTVVIAPIFSMTAYGEPGFYTYYRDECDTSCITSIPIGYELSPTYHSSVNTIKILSLLDYPILTDIEVDKFPEILKSFDKVIVLHNEYVTRTEFEAIINHPKVLYLHPNALYAEIKANYEEDTISLVRGHDYPEPGIKNGFDWEFDNSHLEYDNCKEGWKFYEIDNGIMLNCYPENIIYNDENLLKMIKDY